MVKKEAFSRLAILGVNRKHQKKESIVTYKKVLLTFLSLFLLVALIGCSENAQEPSPTSSSYTTVQKGDTLMITFDDRERPTTALATATATFSVRGPTNLGYWTMQIIQNSTVRWQNTAVVMGSNYKFVSISGLPVGCGYIAKVWNNFAGIQSNTWPSKCISGTTHLGCLEFNDAGEPSPWQGSCP